MLHGRRKRLEQIAEREARGESLWTKSFDAPVRMRIWAFLEIVLGRVVYLDQRVVSAVRTSFLTELGRELPSASKGRLMVKTWVTELDDSDMPSLLEAIVASMGDRDHGLGVTPSRAINSVLNEHRIAFEMINGEMVEFESKELHSEVVAPVLRLLSGRPGWDKVESAYQDALREISDNKPGDAITDAGTALQEALVTLGCTGNALGPLAKDARKKGLLAPHDETLNDAIQKIIDWVSADRSTTGDAHKASQATRDDAWLAVHVVGALILRLAGGSPRA